jgi:hypothetical protein
MKIDRFKIGRDSTNPYLHIRIKGTHDFLFISKQKIKEWYGCPSTDVQTVASTREHAKLNGMCR